MTILQVFSTNGRELHPSPSQMVCSGIAVTLLDKVGEVALATVVAVEVHRHEDARPANFMWELTSQSRHLVIAVDLVKLQHCQLHLLLLVLQLLGLCVGLLLALFRTTIKRQGQKQCRFVFKATFFQGLSVAQRATAENQALLFHWHTMGGRKLLFQTPDVCISVCGNGEGPPREVADKELHRSAGQLLNAFEP